MALNKIVIAMTYLKYNLSTHKLIKAHLKLHMLLISSHTDLQKLTWYVKCRPTMARVKKNQQNMIHKSLFPTKMLMAILH